jgi:hypothetical protein
MDAFDVLDLRAFLGVTRMVYKDAIHTLSGQEPEDDDDVRESSDIG